MASDNWRDERFQDGLRYAAKSALHSAKLLRALGRKHSKMGESTWAACLKTAAQEMESWVDTLPIATKAQGGKGVPRG